MNGQEIARLRKDTKLSHVKFSRLLSVCESAVCHWEAGRRIPAKIYMMYLERLREKIDEIKNNGNFEIKKILIPFLSEENARNFSVWLFTDSTNNLKT